MADDLARAFVSFFAIIDPIGNVAVFYFLTRPLSLARQVQSAAIAVGAAFLMLLLFILAGAEVLEFLGITTDSFKVAAGLLLLPPAYRLVERGQPMEVRAQQQVEPADIALVPLATPLIAGPGALATSIALSDRVGTGTTTLAMSLVLALSFALFATAARIFAVLGQSLLRLLSRLVGILLFAIAVNFILEGLSDTF